MTSSSMACAPRSASSGGQLCPRSRPGRDCTEAFPELAELSAGLRKRRVLLDGELVCLNDEGDQDFTRLRARLGSTGREARLAARRAQPPRSSPSTCSTSTGARRARCPTQGGGRCSPSGRDVGSRADGLAGGLRSSLWGIARAGRAPDSAQGGGRSAGGPVSGAGHVRSDSQGAERSCRRACEGRHAGLEGPHPPIGGDRFRSRVCERRTGPSSEGPRVRGRVPTDSRARLALGDLLQDGTALRLDGAAPAGARLHRLIRGDPRALPADPHPPQLNASCSSVNGGLPCFARDSLRHAITPARCSALRALDGLDLRTQPLAGCLSVFVREQRGVGLLLVHHQPLAGQVRASASSSFR